MTPISSDTPIAICVNEYTANPESVAQKNHNVAIVKNVTKKLKECCGNNYPSSVEQKRLAKGYLESANQNLLNEIVEHSAKLLLENNNYELESKIEDITNFLLVAGAEITDKAKQLFLAYYTKHMNRAQSREVRYESDRSFNIEEANRVRAYIGESIMSEDHLKTQKEILRNQQEIIKTQQETIKTQQETIGKFNEQMAILLGKIDDTEEQAKKGCVIC